MNDLWAVTHQILFQSIIVFSHGIHFIYYFSYTNWLYCCLIQTKQWAWVNTFCLKIHWQYTPRNLRQTGKTGPTLTKQTRRLKTVTFTWTFFMDGSISSILRDVLELIEMVRQNSLENHSFLLSSCCNLSNVEHSVDIKDVVE